MATSKTTLKSEATLPQEQVIVNVLEWRTNGRINDAIAGFAEGFRFNDYGIGLEFDDKNTLAEFFRKTREFYPDSSIHIDAILLSGNHVIGEWTLRTVLGERFFGGMKWKLPISLHGASILHTENGKITDWADYYDGATSRRTALTEYFARNRNGTTRSCPMG